MSKIGLISDTKSQIKSPALAKYLFTSHVFKQSMAYADTFCDRWYILSAQHGLLKPDDRTRPYDISLKDLSPDNRFLLAQRILQEILREQITTNDEFIVLAGTMYCDLLSPVFHGRSFNASYPLLKKNIVQRGKWLKEQVENAGQ